MRGESSESSLQNSSGDVNTDATEEHKRWTIRRRQNETVAVQEQELVLAQAADEGNQSANPNPGCPFTMRFPRYRIDMSSATKEQRKQEKEQQQGAGATNIINSGRWFNGAKMALERKMLEQQVYSNSSSNKGRGRIPLLWVDYNSQEMIHQPKPSASTNTLQVERNMYAFVTFWDTIIGQSSESDEASSEGVGVVAMAFPNVSSLVVQRMVDIYEWYVDWAENEILQTQQQQPPDQNSNLRQQPHDAYNYAWPKVELGLQKSSSSIPVIMVHYSPSSQNTASMPLSLSDSEIQLTEQRTKSWVKRLLVDLSICPFTKSVEKSGQGLGDFGVPVARIAYHASAAGRLLLIDENEESEQSSSLAATTVQVQGIPLLMKDTWSAILKMVQAGDRGKEGVSSILLAAPGYDSRDTFPMWAGPIFAMLESGVSAMKLEPLIGVVCFHPHYATPDGNSWPGFGHMHSVPRLQAWYNDKAASNNAAATSSEESSSSSPSSSPSKQLSNKATILTEEQVAAGGAWQRRTPHATINILRAEQLQAAEGRRATADLYARNIDVLVNEVGLDTLYQDLVREQDIC
jgi:hypothetical protein